MAAIAQHVVKAEFENAYIQIFKKNYVLTKGEPERKSLASTSDQGSMSIRKCNNPEVKRIMNKIINTETNEPYSWISLQDLSLRLVTDHNVTNEETAFDVLKTHYCYATGGLIVEYYNGSPRKVKTHLYPPHAEIEHVLAWRTMLAIGGGIASIPMTGTKDTITFRENANLAQADWYEQLVRDGSLHLPNTYIEGGTFEIKKAENVHAMETKLREMKLQLQLQLAKEFDSGITTPPPSDSLRRDIDKFNEELERQAEEYTHENYIIHRRTHLNKNNTTKDGAQTTKKVVAPILNVEFHNVILNSNDLRERFLDSISHYGIDWLQGSEFTGQYPSEILVDMANRGINIINLMQNMIKIVTNGMCYSCRSWNQIKSEACLVRIVQTPNNRLTFGVYNSGLDVIIGLFLAHIYKGVDGNKRTILRDYVEYIEYDETDELATNINSIYKGGERRTTEGGNMWDGTSYSGANRDIGTQFHYLEGTPNRNYTMAPPEFNWLRSIFSGMSYKQAYDHMNKNVRYVLDRICVLLNEYIYERGYFQAKIMETPHHATHPNGIVAMGDSTMSDAITNITCHPLPRRSPGSPDRKKQRQEAATAANSQHAAAIEHDAAEPLSMSDLRKHYIEKFVAEYPEQEAAAASSNGGRKKKTKRKKTRKKKTRRKKKRTRRKK